MMIPAISILDINGQQVLSVSDLSSLIKAAVEKNFRNVKVRGEVSGLKIHSSGHIYFSLKDSDSVINAILWRGTKVSFPLEDGVEIIAGGRITVYPSRSQYQLIVEEAYPSGEGALLKLLKDRHKKFQEMGYFDRKLPLPKYPDIIGIVTSKTGAVLQDMLHRLRDRYPFCYTLVWPVNVQGAGAAEQIATAIRGFNFMIMEKRPNVLIVARGGGSTEDLWPFNEEIVIKAAFESKIPLISAVGHETDTTLIDYASDLRAPTPTAAIEFATPVLSEVKIQFAKNVERLLVYLSRMLRELSSKVEGLSKSVISCKFAVLAISQRFDDRLDKFTLAMNSIFNREILKLQQRKLMKLSNYLEYKQSECHIKFDIFEKLVKSTINKYFDMLGVLFNRLEQSSYKKILAKGFCFIRDKKSKLTITTKHDFDKCDNKSNLEITFVDGTSDYTQSKIS